MVAGCAGQLSAILHEEGIMYERPQVQRFGSLRDLTLVGFDADGDGGVILGIANGCNLIPTGDCRS